MTYTFQKQPARGVPRKRCSENMQQIYRRKPMPKRDFNKAGNNFKYIFDLNSEFSIKGCFINLNLIYL